MKLNFLASLPLHKQVHIKITNDIHRGIYSRNIRLPSVKELSAESCVSAITIERAYRQLLKDGLISHVKGKGYFVTGEQQCI